MKIEHKKEEARSQKSEVRISHSNFYILTYIFLLLTTSCQAQKPSSSYYEDLSSLRPKVKVEEIKPKDSTSAKKQILDVTPQYTVNAKVDAILDSIDRFNLTRKFVDGFTIQIYSGQKREEALNASKKMAESISGLRSTTQYQQPKFRVTVGKYFTRIEAQKDLLRLKQVFSNAILVPERIMIK
jgi:septal ring-binding cell division protein DamX